MSLPISIKNASQCGTCYHSTMRNQFIYQTLAIAVTVSALALCYDYWATHVNPYSEDTWVTPFFATSIGRDGSLGLAKVRDTQVVYLPLASLILYADIVHESILRFFARDPDGPIAGNEEEIISALHTERFDPSRAYVITGGHFPDFCVRNLGIFYNSILDPRIPASEDDWANRQRITLQTLATHLELLKVAGKEYTTFAPVGPHAFAAINWNDEPSDSLFAITYTLRAATDDFLFHAASLLLIWTEAPRHTRSQLKKRRTGSWANIGRRLKKSLCCISRSSWIRKPAW